MYGSFEVRSPSYILRDPELIKKIIVKDFDFFVDRRAFISAESDPLFGNALFSLTGQKWKDMRATLSPAFTGSKMRNMFSLIRDCSNVSIDSIKSQLKGHGDVFEMKDFFGKFTVDTIATCAFGIEVDSVKNPENDFQRVADKISNFDGAFGALKLFGLTLCPKLMNILKIQLFGTEVTEFFRTAVHETMSLREQKGIVRPDMINLLMQAKKGEIIMF